MLAGVEFEISADFGIFRMPYNQNPSLTFNFIPKSSALGIIGAVIGLNGYDNGSGNYAKDDNFITSLSNFKLAIKPELASHRGKPVPFTKSLIYYQNYHGYGNEGEALLLYEQVLLKPKYTITVISEKTNKYFESFRNNLKSRNIIFRPYLGKNEFLANIKLKNYYEKVEEFRPNNNEPFECDGIFSMANEYISPIKNDERGIPEFLMIENYPYTLDEYQRYVTKNFEYKIGKLYKEEADRIGRFYQVAEKIIYFF